MKIIKIVITHLTALFIVNMVCISTPVKAQEGRLYPSLTYVEHKCILNQSFFTLYESIYEANKGKINPIKAQQKRWDKVNEKIFCYLKDPRVKIILSRDGQISFSGLIAPYDGNYFDKNLSRKNRRENEMASILYGTVLKTTIIEWYKQTYLTK